MATTATAESSPKRTIEISGFVVQLKKRLKHSLYIKYGIDKRKLVKISKRLSKNIDNEEQKFTLGSPVELQEEMELTFKLAGERCWYSGSVAVTAGFNNIWANLETPASTKSESRFKAYEDNEKQIWFLARAHQGSLDGSGQSSVNALKTAQSEINGAVKKLEEFKTVLDHLGKAKGPLDTAMNLGVVVAGLHPISTLVVGCVNVVYEQLKIPDQSRDQMLTLAKGVGNLAESIRDVDGIAKSATLKKTLEEFPGFMTEVADFISRWLGSWTERTPFSDSEGKISGFVQRLGALEKEFPLGLLIDIRVAQELKALEDALVGTLKFRPLAEECLPGTRIDILLDIKTKLGIPDAQEEDEKNVIWIKGYPGVGKSSLAASVVAVLDKQDRLGSYFVFERAYSGTTTTNNLCCHVAVKLASRYPSARQFLLENVTKTNFDPQTRNIESLFSTLVKGPLLALIESKDIPDGHSPAFVIDALDECGGLEGSQSEDRKSLLQIIKLWQQHIPKEFKLVVTSRVEDDISRALDDISIPIHIPSGSNNTPASEADIRLYFQSTLQKLVPKIPSLHSSSAATSWIEEVSNTLAPRAAGVFIWATTAAKFLERNPRRHYEQILKQGLDTTKSIINGIYSLYSTILEISFGHCPDDEARAFVSVVSVAVVAKRPLENADLTKLPGVDIDTLEVIRSGLESVIEPGAATFRFVHQSFVDFLLSPKSGCPSRLAIDESSAQCQLAELCLDAMQSQLRFNICNLETSARRNTDIPDLSVKIKNNISSLLLYSCSFWVEHLSWTPFGLNRMELLKEIINEKLLFWFECMSLMKETVRVSPALLQVLSWSKSDEAEDEVFTMLVRDALRFVAIFSQPIRESAPHIYISALSFAPSSSAVAKHFSPKYPGILSVMEGRPTYWPFYKFSAHNHQDTVTCIAFSPDKKSFASGDRIGVISLCDSETGSPLSSPFDLSREIDLSDMIMDIWLGPHGKQIAARSSSGHVQLWDVDSHKTWQLQDRGRASQIQWTKDGKHIIAMHFDHLSHTRGTLKTGCLTDNTVIIWCVEDGSIIGQFQDPQTLIFSYIYFPGNHTLFLQGPKHLKIWSMEHREFLYSFEVNSVQRLMSLSDDGRELLIGHFDGTVRMLTLDGARDLSSTHHEDQRSDNLGVRFHGCSGEKLFYSSDDGPDGTITVQVYDASTNSTLPNLAPIRPTHPPDVISVSPDGKHILSSSGELEGAFQVWDAQSGRLIAQPEHERQGEGMSLIQFIFQSTDQRLITYSYSSLVVSVWSEDMTRQEFCRTLKDAHDAHVNQVSPDGSTALVYRAMEETLWRVTADDKHFEYVQHLTSNDWDVCKMVYSRSGKFIAISKRQEFNYGQSTIELWGITESRNLVAHASLELDQLILTLAISPKFNEHIILFSDSGTMKIWNAATGKFVSSMPWRSRQFDAEELVFLESGERLASLRDRTIKVWDMTNLGDLDSPGGFEDDTEIKDGWAMGRDGELLFWVPPEHRYILWRPRNVAMIGPSTRLDFTNFKYGDKWAECIDEKYRK
ncbi:hypothetical protein NP233_g6560 [Leucocoprinus birnbaumii]|uniref:Nephrocystin 3-like N-terminal domain-containing protein n=1 Tax=Leucocoprinus birnbaumii TaxID=56174 RepID=A0AAD5YVN5_9AGAR|nr:hypothetical protein NP233_g6560 [Leucocoprinus birnbaumii]